MFKYLNIKILKCRSGFSLIEIFFVISITVLVAFGVGTFIMQGFKATHFGSEQEMAVSSARKLTPTMVSEIREATQSDRGDYVLDDVEDQNFSFYSDVDSDENVEKIRYFLDNTTFKKGITEATGTPSEYLPENEIVTDVSYFMNNEAEPVFTYYDVDNNLIADPVTNKNDIRLIHISLKINVTPTIAPNDYYVEMDAQIRNLKDNL
ncbi:hypothetical protein HOD96_02880 [Candidatus Falkowbacteria bacterium]|jgi:hypothetical protein|nr:hypothetical protein [Candidatus Falkowbacteria bacterium]